MTTQEKKHARLIAIVFAGVVAVGLTISATTPRPPVQEEPPYIPFRGGSVSFEDTSAVIQQEAIRNSVRRR